MSMLKHLQSEKQYHSDGGEQKNEDTVDDKPRQPRKKRENMALRENNRMFTMN